jgi:hypothetical protein
MHYQGLANAKAIGERLAAKSARKVLAVKDRRLVRAPASMAEMSTGQTLLYLCIQDEWDVPRMLASWLEERFSAYVNINCYITPPWSQGFALHSDDHHVLVLQISGTKEWTLAASMLILEERHGMIVQTPQATRAVVLHAGDMLYIPTGLQHKAIAQREASIHLSIGIHIA